MSLTAVIFWLVYAGMTGAALFNPVAGLALYILVYHLHPETQWWAQTVRASGLRTSMTVALATGIGMLIRRPRLEDGARQFQPAYVLAILLALLALGSLAWGVGLTERGQYQAEKFLKELVILFILVRCVRTPLHFQVIFLSWLAGVLYVGYYAYGGVGLVRGGRLDTGLGGPDFGESSDLAVHLVATLPMIGAAFFMARSWWGRGAALILGALTVNTLIMTRTRNALFGLALMTLAGVLSLPRGYRVRGVLAVAVGSLLAVQLTDPGWWARMYSISNYTADSSSMQRLTIWAAALQMAVDYPLGIGLGNFHTFIMEYVPELTMIRGAHSTPLACLAELGWAGLLVFLAIVCVVLHQLGRVRRQANNLPSFTDIHLARFRSRFHLGWHAMALRAAFIGYLGCGLFTTRLFSEDFWLLVGFAMCLSNVANRLVAEHEAQTAPASAHAVALEAPPVLPGVQPQPRPG